MHHSDFFESDDNLLLPILISELLYPVFENVHIYDFLLISQSKASFFFVFFF